jgi:hypothetical protein
MPAALLELKLTLVGVKPPVWRRLVVTNQISLKRLHELLQVVAGWDDKHLHEFVIDKRRYGQPAPHEVVPVENEALFRLHSLPFKVGTTFSYVYDFGDHWEIEVKVERIRPLDPKEANPRVLGGTRAFPPEDSGGPGDYEDLREALTDPGHPEHEEYRDWVGEDFDPEHFDLEETNERLGQLT